MKQLCVNNLIAEKFENALYKAKIDFQLDPQGGTSASSVYIILEDGRIAEAEKILCSTWKNRKGGS